MSLVVKSLRVLYISIMLAVMIFFLSLKFWVDALVLIWLIGYFQDDSSKISVYLGLAKWFSVKRKGKRTKEDKVLKVFRCELSFFNRNGYHGISCLLKSVRFVFIVAYVPMSRHHILIHFSIMLHCNYFFLLGCFRCFCLDVRFVWMVWTKIHEMDLGHGSREKPKPNSN